MSKEGCFSLNILLSKPAVTTHASWCKDFPSSWPSPLSCCCWPLPTTKVIKTPITSDMASIFAIFFLKIPVAVAAAAAAASDPNDPCPTWCCLWPQCLINCCFWRRHVLEHEKIIVGQNSANPESLGQPDFFNVMDLKQNYARLKKTSLWVCIHQFWDAIIANLTYYIFEGGGGKGDWPALWWLPGQGDPVGVATEGAK